MYEETRSIQRHGKQKDRGIWPLLTVPSPSYMIMGGKSGSIDILGMITYMAWPVIMKRGCTTNQNSSMPASCSRPTPSKSLPKRSDIRPKRLPPR